jgi:hypothetical protein
LARAAVASAVRAVAFAAVGSNQQAIMKFGDNPSGRAFNRAVNGVEPTLIGRSRLRCGSIHFVRGNIATCNTVT